MKVFITGASGFIGSYVAHQLHHAGHELIAAVRDPDKLPWLTQQRNISVVTASLDDHAALRRHLVDCDACVHIALGWGDTAVDMLTADTLATAVLLQACIDAGVARFVYTSSTAAVGHFLPLMDERVKTTPVDLYGATKAASENYVLACGAVSDLHCTIIRPGYTFGNPVVDGAVCQPDRRFADLMRQVQRGEPVKLSAGDGTQFIWAGDLAKVYAAALISEHRQQTYFALGRQFVSWEQLVREAIDLCGSTSEVVVHGEAQAPSLFDVGKLNAHFGLRFDAYPHITGHLRYHLEQAARQQR